MTENAAPLTRREARAMERRTGRRAVAGGVAPAVLELPAAPEFSFEHDTSVIERNAATALVSVLPTELIERVAAPEAESGVEASSAFARPVSIRASRPVALVARGRRRAAAGLGIAATAAALATAAIAVPSAQASQQQADQAAQASLLSAANVAEGTAQTDTIVDAKASVAVAPAVAAQESASDRGQYTVTSFEVGALEELPKPTVATSTSGGTNGGGSTGGSNGGGGNGGGGHDTSSIAGIASSYVGGGEGWACTTFTSRVYAQVGISLSGPVSVQASQGTRTDNPQVGDLVVFPGQHIGIYAGGGMMWDAPGDPGRVVEYRSVNVIGSSYHFVTLR